MAIRIELVNNGKINKITLLGKATFYFYFLNRKTIGMVFPELLSTRTNHIFSTRDSECIRKIIRLITMGGKHELGYNN